VAARRGYNPCHDPGFGDALLRLFLSRPGERLNVYRELFIVAPDRVTYHCVCAHVRRLRRRGYAIEGGHDGTYRLSGVASDATGQRG
jgi:hypothetical protein